MDHPTPPESPEALRAQLLALLAQLPDDAILRIWGFVRWWTTPLPPSDTPVPR